MRTGDSQVSAYTPFHFSFTVPLNLETYFRFQIFQIFGGNINIIFQLWDLGGGWEGSQLIKYLQLLQCKIYNLHHKMFLSALTHCQHYVTKNFGQ